MESAESTLSYEEEILAKHSTPGLKRNELNRYAKRDHLASLKVPKIDADKILDQLYGTQETSPDAQALRPPIE